MARNKFYNELFKEPFLTGLHKCIIETRRTGFETGFDVYYFNNIKKFVYPELIDLGDEHSLNYSENIYYKKNKKSCYSKEIFEGLFDFNRFCLERTELMNWKNQNLDNHIKFPDFSGKDDARHSSIGFEKFYSKFKTDKNKIHSLIYFLHCHPHKDNDDDFCSSFFPSYYDLHNLKYQRIINNYNKESNLPIYLIPVVNTGLNSSNIPILIFQEKTRDSVEINKIRNLSRNYMFLFYYQSLLLGDSLEEIKENEMGYLSNKYKKPKDSQILDLYNLDLGFYNLKKKSLRFNNNLGQFIFE